MTEVISTDIAITAILGCKGARAIAWIATVVGTQIIVVADFVRVFTNSAVGITLVYRAVVAITAWFGRVQTILAIRFVFALIKRTDVVIGAVVWLEVALVVNAGCDQTIVYDLRTRIIGIIDERINGAITVHVTGGQFTADDARVPFGLASHSFFTQIDRAVIAVIACI